MKQQAPGSPDSILREIRSQLPYLMPHVDETSAKNIVAFADPYSGLADELDKAMDARIVRYHPAFAEGGARPDGVSDLIVSLDALESIPESKLDSVIADMASLGAKAIIFVGAAKTADDAAIQGDAAVTQEDQDRWAERLGAHFPYLEPIRVRSKRRAAFKTWKSDDSRQLPNFMIFVREELKYQWRKLRGI